MFGDQIRLEHGPSTTDASNIWKLTHNGLVHCQRSPHPYTQNTEAQKLSHPALKPRKELVVDPRTQPKEF